MSEHRGPCPWRHAFFTYQLAGTDTAGRYREGWERLVREDRPMARKEMAAVAALVALAGWLQAGEDDSVPLGSGGCDHTYARAGHPDEISHCARPTNTPAYCGYYVGGSCVCRGGPPGPLDGTYGWDYCGCHYAPHHVFLGWCYCHRYKGGEGAYRTESCPVPNVFSCKLPDRSARCEGGACEGNH
jgi:hypothetical protein